MSIYIDKIRIRNYKSVQNLEMVLDKDLTVLIGQNNVGKTAILEAIRLGFNYNVVEKEYVFFTQSYPFSQDKEIIIDPVP
ncbi:MAG: AAA family ATPase [Alkaliphilus sp.]